MLTTAIDEILEQAEMFFSLATATYAPMSHSQAAGILGIFDDSGKSEILSAYRNERSRLSSRPFAGFLLKQLESAFKIMMEKAKELRLEPPAPPAEAKNVIKLEAEDNARSVVALYENDPDFMERYIELQKSRWNWFSIIKYVEDYDNELAELIAEGYERAREHGLVGEYRRWFCDTISAIMYQKISYMRYQQQSSFNACLDQPCA